MKAEIIAIGSELVSGQSLDTNSQWISKALGALGIEVRFHSAVGDDLTENIAVLRIAIDRADLIITSGGLGPTQDDLTREALAAVAGVSLVEDAGSLEAIKTLFDRRNREMSGRNRVQALFPEGAEPLPNAIGTAPGIGMAVGNVWLACLPGVPYEMKRMFDDQVIARLISRGFATRKIVHRKINLFGKGESDIEAMALDLTTRGRVPEVGITASEATIAFRITAEAATEDEALSLIEPTAALIYERFGDLIVGEGTDDVVEALAQELARTGQSIATAESCTGGLIARMLTSIPGISANYPGGLVTYSNQAKAKILGVSEELLEAQGAVSAEVAAEMARLVRDRFSTDLGLSVTGIAGPTSDSPDHPVGLVYLGLATSEKVMTRKLELGPEQPRDIIQRRAAKQALNWARVTLKTIKLT
jgi:nicotinamide-nucleotide amidase